MKPLRLLMLSLVAVLTAPLASAEEVRLPLAPEIESLKDLYTVEVVLFEQPNPAINEEHWPETLPAPDFSRAFLPQNHDGLPLSLGETLPRTSFALTNEVSRLSRAGYRILYHNSWMQQFAPNTQSTLLVSEPLAGLEGTLRIERQRYLHVYPDLRWMLTTRESLEPVSIGMIESRRMRSSELHYIDHPILGMLVLFRPVISE